MNIDMIRDANQRLMGYKRVTPLLSSPFIDEIAGKRVFVKAECLQHTGSFKFRGAFSAISALDKKTRENGILAYSSGNHAQGIALAAKMHMTPSTIVMPADAPKVKIANTRALGAEVILYHRAIQDRDEIGTKIANDRNLHLVKPYDDPHVIAGQGTTGLELIEQAKDLGIDYANVLVCCGGGGLTSGIALACAADAAGYIVSPVEPEHFDDVCRSLSSGKREKNPSQSGSICDAVVTPSPGEITFPILSRHCKSGIVVTENETLQAMKIAFERLRIVVEPGGAIALAAALFHNHTCENDTIIAVASGGNVDESIFIRALGI